MESKQLQQLQSSSGAIERPRRLRHSRLAVIAGLLLATGCSWKSWAPRERPPPLPENAPRSLVTLTLGEPHPAVLDCAQQNCNHWYRVSVPRPGRLEVVVDTHEIPNRPIIRVLIREPTQRPLAQTMGADDGTLRLEAPVQRGLYLVLVQAGGARLPYTLTARLGGDAGSARPSPSRRAGSPESRVTGIEL
jgi:hypothetical protein